MEVVGVIAGTLTLLTYVPQAYRTIKTRKTRDLSLVTLLLLCASALLWVIYGILGDLPAVWLTNSIVLVLGVTIVSIKVKS